MFGQSALCTLTPCPFEIYPRMESPGIGWHHCASDTAMVSIPGTMTPQEEAFGALLREA